MSINKLTMRNDSIIDWFAGRTLFITGGTGFMGKVLIEKLLRCIPDLKKIYVLCRPKKGFSPGARLEEMTKLPLFEKLRKTNPSVFKKLVAVDGDLIEKDLGIHPKIKEDLINEVSVVISGAASLRLEASLKPAVMHNTFGTQRILDLCCQIKHLKAFVHLSTAFCHCEYETLEEVIYPTPVSPRDVMHVVQWMDDTTLEMITPKLLGPHPNCYTFSKRLSESLVNEYMAKIPVAIARPSIVTPALIEPMPGWVDNLNGPVGITIAAGKGILRSMMVVEEFNAEVIPVDVAINAIITIAWERGRTPKEKDETTPVYNISNGDVQTMSWGEVFEKGKTIGYEYPFEAGLWYPNGRIRTNPVTHFLAILFLQIIPAYFIDALLFLTGQKTFMVRVQKRIYIGLQVLQYFTTRKWRFANNKVRELHEQVNDKEKEIFYINNVRADVDKYLKDIILGARQYVMKEPLSTLPKARMQQKIMFWLDLTVQALLYGLIIWYLMRLFNLQHVVSSLPTISSRS